MFPQVHHMSSSTPPTKPRACLWKRYERSSEKLFTWTTVDISQMCISTRRDSCRNAKGGVTVLGSSLL